MGPLRGSHYVPGPPQGFPCVQMGSHYVTRSANTNANALRWRNRCRPGGGHVVACLHAPGFRWLDSGSKQRQAFFQLKAPGATTPFLSAHFGFLGRPHHADLFARVFDGVIDVDTVADSHVTQIRSQPPEVRKLPGRCSDPIAIKIGGLGQRC